MLEQHALQGGFALAREWGPIATLAALFLVWEIVKFIKPELMLKKMMNGNGYSGKSECCNNEGFRKQEEEILKLRNSVGSIYQEIANVKIEMKDRVTYDWAEDKILPKIDELYKNINQQNVLLAGIKATIDTNTERLKNIESSIK